MAEKGGSERQTRRVGVPEAVSQIKTGSHLLIAGMAAEPRELVKETLKQQDRLRDITIYTSFPIGESLYEEKEGHGSFSIKTFSIGSLHRAIESRQA